MNLMRLSADQNDPGFRPDYRSFAIAFNGVVRGSSARIVTADEKSRALIVCDADECGRIILSDGRARLKGLVGSVEMKRIPGASRV